MSSNHYTNCKTSVHNYEKVSFYIVIENIVVSAIALLH